MCTLNVVAESIMLTGISVLLGHTFIKKHEDLVNSNYVYFVANAPDAPRRVETRRPGTLAARSRAGPGGRRNGGRWAALVRTVQAWAGRLAPDHSDSAVSRMRARDAAGSRAASEIIWKAIRCR